LISDKEILSKIASGNEEVFKIIFDKYYNDLCKFVYCNFIKDKSEAEEIVQNIIIKLWENKNNAEKIVTLKSYLYKSVVNACLNYIKHQNIINNYQNKISVQLKEIQFEDFEFTEADEDEKKVIDELENLPEQTKKIFNLKYLRGLKYKEIAKELNISEKTVETLIYRGLKQLRKKLNI
jgi:RNA polymerase sigma-70 factor (ECF subfamily)